jgi:hypothetical protein
MTPRRQIELLDLAADATLWIAIGVWWSALPAAVVAAIWMR